MFTKYRHNLIKGVSKCMISIQEARAKFDAFDEPLGLTGTTFRSV